MTQRSNQTTAPGAKPSRTRLYVDDGLAARAVAELDRSRAHYLRDVLRLRAGDRVRLFNGRDGEWEATISELTKSSARLDARDQVRPQAAESGPTLLFAPVKRAAIDLIVEKAVELGAAVLQPTITKYTDVSRVNLDRLRAIAVEAAEQSERLTVAEVCEPVKLAAWLERKPLDRPLLACAERVDCDGLAAAVARLPDGASPILLTGPEGGFRADELEMLSETPGTELVSLGPLVLRAETAAIAALAIAGALRR